jgi:fungal nitric oxide reductase
MVAPFFSQEHTNAMRPHIQKTVDSLLDNMLKVGGEKPFDIVDKFALPVPSYVSPLAFRQTYRYPMC